MGINIREELKNFDIDVTMTDPVALFSDVDKSSATGKDAEKLHSLLKAFGSLDQILDKRNLEEQKTDGE